MNFSHFHFAEPDWLWLAAVVPIFLTCLFAHAEKKRREQLAKIASPNFVEQLTQSHSAARRRGKEILVVAVFIFAALALARPQWGRFEKVNEFVGEDIVFALDCSLSMTTTDVLPSRLERAKFSILDFVRKENHGRVGIVAFAGSAFLQCPLTFDQGAFEETLMAMDEKTIPIPGTDIGRALNEANQAMDKNARHKTVVLVTDGEDLEKSGVVEAKKLATNGVVVFTVGVGTSSGKEIQFVNTNGQNELLHDANGDIVRSQLDEKTLREIAEATGGSYLPLGNLGEGLVRVKSAMHSLDVERSLRETKKLGVERFYLPLAVCLALLAAEPLIGTRKKNVPV
jgi:Ca-activated chloride channel homolog